MPDTRWNSLTDIAGLRVGHAQDEAALTGCTVILCEAGATGGVDVRGGAPGTRETDALHPLHLVTQVHAIVLAGGSAFGLEAATGVVRYLEQRGVGFDVGVARVPIVPAAILFDLGVGSPAVRPDAAMGYQACLNASGGAVPEGNVGAGIGATVGKARGLPQAMKAGLGACSLAITDNLTVAALAVTNAFGDVVDPSTGEILAGVRQDQDQAGASPFADTLKVLADYASKPPLRFGQRENTVLGVVATNARLDKEQVNKVAAMAHDGLARAIRPAHTMLDGDTIFALATGEVDADVNIVGAFAAQAFAEAIVRSVKNAAPLAGLPSASSLRTDSR